MSQSQNLKLGRVKLHRTIRACQKCGKSFFGGTDKHFCDDCVKELKSNIFRERICIDCGITFLGAPKSKRCKDCQYQKNLKDKRRYSMNGPVRKIGDIDKCEICGNEYIVIASKQKYCSEDCKIKGLKKWEKEHKKDYHKTPKIKANKQLKRDSQCKICKYCLKSFKSDIPDNTCSDFCKREHGKLLQAYADERRGIHRNIAKLEEKREICRNN